MASELNVIDNRVDPLQFLSDDCMLHILEFVGNRDFDPYADMPPLIRNCICWQETENGKKINRERKRMVDNQEGFLHTHGGAVQFYYSLASVSHHWKSFVDRAVAPNPKVLQVKVLFSLVRDSRELAVLSQKQFSVALISDNSFSISPHFHSFLKQANTANLKTAQFSLFSTLKKAGKARDTELRQQKAMQDLIATQCPIVDKLCFRISWSALELMNQYCHKHGSLDNYPGLSSQLFSKDSIRSVSIDFDLNGGEHDTQINVNPMLITFLIRKWDNLESLSLEARHQTNRSTLENPPSAPVLYIQSASLEHFNVYDFNYPTHIVFELDCSKLQKCTGVAALLVGNRQIFENLPRGCHLSRIHFEACLDSDDEDIPNDIFGEEMLMHLRFWRDGNTGTELYLENYTEHPLPQPLLRHWGAANDIVDPRDGDVAPPQPAPVQQQHRRRHRDPSFPTRENRQFRRPHRQRARRRERR